MKIAVAIASCAIAIPAAAQTAEPPAIAIGVSAGFARLESSWLVAGGDEAMLAGRVTVRLHSRVSVDVERSRTGKRAGRPYSWSPGGQWLQERRERTLGFYARIHAWRAKEFAVEFLAGASRISAETETFGRSLNGFTGEWRDWRRIEPGIVPSLDPPDPGWRLAFGVDTPIGTRRFAFVPELRILTPMSSAPATSGSPSRYQVRWGLGLRVGY